MTPEERIHRIIEHIRLPGKAVGDHAHQSGETDFRRELILVDRSRQRYSEVNAGGNSWDAHSDWSDWSDYK